MIPKQLFFIWFGNKPNYVDYAVNTFKEVNKDFKINFIYYTISEIENIDKINKYIYDIDVCNCIQYILYHNRYQISINRYLNRFFLQCLCNILRLELISRYGGIYLDCDTFPLKPFDDELLKKKNFLCKSYNRTNQTDRVSDCFFLGSEKNNYYYDNFNAIQGNVNCGKINYLKDKEWNDNRKLFYNCELKYKKEDYSYIEHYCDYTWDPNKCRTPKCKYDLIWKTNNK